MSSVVGVLAAAVSKVILNDFIVARSNYKYFRKSRRNVCNCQLTADGGWNGRRGRQSRTTDDDGCQITSAEPICRPVGVVTVGNDEVVRLAIGSPSEIRIVHSTQPEGGAIICRCAGSQA